MRRSPTGFTLIEVMVAVVIMAIIVAAILGAYSAASRGVSEAARIEDAQKMAREAVSRLTDEMRGADNGQITIQPDPDGPGTFFLGNVITFQREYQMGMNIWVRWFVTSGTIRTGQDTSVPGWAYGQGVIPDRMLVRQEYHPSALTWTEWVRNPWDPSEQPSDPNAPWDVFAANVHIFHEGDYAEATATGLKITPTASGAKEYIVALTVRVPGSQCAAHWQDPTQPRGNPPCLWYPKKTCRELNRVQITQVSIRN